METFFSADEAAQKVGLSARRLRQLLKQGRVKDARKVGRQWIIPESVELLPPDRDANRIGKAPCPNCGWPDDNISDADLGRNHELAVAG
jgi:hypothetical protein